MKFKSLLAVAGLLCAGMASAGQGYYGQGGSQGNPTWPNPSSTSGTLPLTGQESWVVDTQLPNGQNPQSEYVSINMVANSLGAGPGGSRNALIGGDFTTNLFQRGTSVTGIANTLTYGPDRWFAVGGASSVISLLKETTNLPLTPNNQFGASLRFSQVSTTDIVAVNLGQVVSTENSYKFVGNNAILSFWAKKGAGAPTTFTATINSGTAADGSAANLAAAGWTGNVANSCTITPATTWARYSCSYPIASTMKQVGVLFSFVPTGTSGTTDWIEFAGVQLEASSLPTAWAASGNYLANEVVVSNGNTYKETATTCTAGSTAPSGTAVFTDSTCSWTYVSGNQVPVQASGFDFRLAGFEKSLQYQYAYVVTESAATSPVPASCTMDTTSIAICSVPFPVPMRAVPTVTFATGFAIINAHSNVACTGNTNPATLTTAVVSTTGTFMACASSAGFSATSTSGILANAGGTGKITASAEY